ncbi:hypothetical protein [Streptomyces sp. 7N604]|uniref:hypothetical protein n=1 Tax=Streptomyces sp. 7N604 TaxID=3457415 RepID=UPI003FD66AE4
MERGVNQRPSLTAVAGGKIIGVAWTRPLYTGEDAQRGVADLSLFAAAARADCVILSWETCDLAIACDLPLAALVPTLNILVAGDDGSHLHYQFPYDEQRLDRPLTQRGLQGAAPIWHEPLLLENGPLPAPIRQAVDQAYERRDSMARSGLEPTLVWMRSHGYTVSVIDHHPLRAADDGSDS